MPGSQYPAVIKLSDLNGLNGFKINGEAVNAYTGWQGGLSTAGDINGDGHTDFLIGAWGYNNNKGRGYVIFGGPSVGSNGLISLVTLSWPVGLKLDGENTGDQCGVSVSSAGDVNDDGYADLIMGANGYNSGVGRAYVVFGGPQLNGVSLIPLSSLNGTNGFKMDGEAKVNTASFVSAANDFNDDGYVDLLVSAHGYNNGAGRTYVVFSGPGVGNSGLISLSSLTGANGFKLDGEAAGDASSYPVAPAGDINADGHVDLLIDAIGHNSYTGRSYVIFGGTGVGSTGSLPLSSLNGLNGFKLDGEAVNDQYGAANVLTCSVSQAGDVNGDGYDDLILGAFNHNNTIGRSYVVFGGPGVGDSGLFSLANLNGTNGFKIDGEAYEASGFSVSSAGDINQDGFSDLLIGAPYYNNKIGRTYIVFGSSSIGKNTGLFSLSSLNGTNGFKLDGENSGDSSGTMINTAGDINNDGLPDMLIGAPYYLGANTKVGRVYVLFGDVSPEITANQLVISRGQTVVLTAQNLNATDNAPVIFNISNVQYGHFELMSAPGQAITLFNQSQVLAQQIQFVHDNSAYAPSYLVQVPNTGIALTPPPQAANITFIPLGIINNTLTINQGETVLFTTNNLYAVGDSDANLIFHISALQHGNFTLSTAPTQIFSQQDIINSQVQFIHDNSMIAPTYDVSVTNGLVTTSPAAATIDFDTPPVLVNNQLNAYPRQTQPLDSQSLLAMDNEIDPNDLLFVVSNVQRGHFSYSNQQNQPINQFWQKDISNGKVMFTTDNSGLSPSYQVTVSDGRMNCSICPEAVQVSFHPEGPHAQPAEYCNPSDTCELSDLHDGNFGFVLQGDAAGDYSGVSVSSAGDINGDALSDFIVGALLADSNGRNDTGKTYVLFGSNQTTAWEPGVFNLTNLMNGQHGFVLQGEAAGDYSGASVSGAGDINGDGLADFLLGAYGASVQGFAYAGKTYVILGSNQVNAWGSGVLNISNLMDGQHGFVLQGEMNNELSGYSVSGAGDINGDGLDDMLIGAIFAASDASRIQAGQTYIVFGSNQTNAWGSGVLNLIDLMNGQRGFVLQGEAAGDYSGYSVSSAGDINGDGLVDILISAPNAASATGKTYIVFGTSQTNAWGSGILSLSSLMNGQRGFVLQGEATNDWSGWSVSSAGDINGDGLADILIGAPNAATSDDSPYAGKTYVVLGSNQSNAWDTGILNLTRLMDGQRGFVLQGEAYIQSGISVKGADDIDQDGFADVLIGAFAASPDGRLVAGNSYVIFGTNQIDAWGEGVLNISSLINGQRGFVLEGEDAFDYSGHAVSEAGDINGDGFADIFVGAYYASPSNLSQAGKSYVVFGDTPPVLINNSLSLNSGETIPLTSNLLSAIDRNHNNASLLFVPINISQGQFESNINPAVALTNFTQQQVWQGDIQFVHDGSAIAPSYNIVVQTDGIAWAGPIPATVTFTPLLLINNSLSLIQGQTVLLTTDNLYATGANNNASLSFQISQLQHGQFMLNATAVLSFTQQDIINQQVSFVHDNTAFAPVYDVTVSNGAASTFPATPTIDFDPTPIIVNNQLFLTSSQKITMTGDNFLSEQNGVENPALQYNLTNIQNGQFLRVSQPKNAITTFTQQDVDSKQIIYVPTSNSSAPNFLVQVSDGLAFSGVYPTTAFLVTNNELPINQGEVLQITPSYLNITSNRLNASQIRWNVNSPLHGQFELSSSAGVEVFSFTQQEVNNATVVFVPDNSTNAPSCILVITDDHNQFYGLINANIDFDTPPVLQNNLLNTYPGFTVPLSKTYLLAKDNETPPGNLLFVMSDIQQGHFSYFDSPDQAIDRFWQQNVTDGNVVFVTDTSDVAPSYQVTVSDGRMNCSGCPQAAKITFDPAGPPKTDTPSWSPIVTAAAVTGSIGLLFTLIGLYIKYKLVPTYFDKTKTQGTERERTYRQQVILPIAKHIYNRVKFSGMLGYASEASVKDYVDAVSEIVRQLETLNVDTNLADMRPSARLRLLESIAIQTQKQLVGEKPCCSLKSMKSVVTADTTPALLHTSAVTIAQAVRDDMHSLEISAGADDEKAENKAQHSPGFLRSLWSGSSKTQQQGVPLLHSQSGGNLN